MSDIATFAYVEEVRFPAEIRVGEILEVELEVSMASNNDKLYGLHEYGISSFMRYVYDQSGKRVGLDIDTVMNGPFTAAEPRTNYVLSTFSFDQPGEYTLFVVSADSRENGGLTNRIQLVPFTYIEPHPHLIRREFKFTVLPAEDAARAGE